MVWIDSVYEFFLNKYKKYTEIQEKAFGIIEKGVNCLIIAPTGAGKTEAAVLPVLERIVKEKKTAVGGTLPGVQMIYITPLRALNRDMIKRIESLCKEFDISVAVRHGDTTQSERAKQVRRVPMVLITTPETLQSIMPTKSFGPSLKNVKAVIIDEIHELYYNKRGAQLSIGLERLTEISPNLQRIGISATVGNPELVKEFLCAGREGKIALLDKRKEVSIKVDFPKVHDRRTEVLKEKFGLDNDALSRISTMVHSIEHSKSTLVFANTRQIVEALGSRLLYLNRFWDFGGIGVHHGSLDRQDRIEVENAFKDGKVRSIISTSALELGIDIGHIDLVVQYGSPRQALRLIQRVGRSGHTEKGVSKGLVITVNLIDAIESIAVAKNIASATIESFRPQYNAYDVLANQISGIAQDRGACTADYAFSLVHRSHVYKDLPREKFTELLHFMNRQRMVGFDGTTITAGGRTRMYYYDHLSVIPDSKRFLVRNLADNRIISSLDEGFVVSNIEENTIFITKGLPWKVISIDDDIITVEPSTELEAAVPDWSGEDIPVSNKVSQLVFDIIGGHVKVDDTYSGTELNSEIAEFSELQAKHGTPGRDRVMIEQTPDYKIIHTGLGTSANEALSRMLAHRIITKLGRSVSMKSSPYLIFIEMPEEFKMEAVLSEISRSDLEKELELAVKDTELFRYKFVTVAKLFGIIERNAPVSKSVSRRIMRVLAGTPIYDETMRELMQNYFDIESLRLFFAGVRDGKIKLTTVDTMGLSPISKMVLNSAYYTRELIMPLLPSDELLKTFMKSALAKNMKLLCTYCGFVFQRKVSELKDEKEVRCQSCNSTMIAPYRDDYKEMIEKRRRERRFSVSDMEEMKDMMKQASLFDSYGGKAAVALSIYGIGPTTAARILMMRHRGDKQFFVDLIEAQKKFVKTRKYWAV